VLDVSRSLLLREGSALMWRLIFVFAFNAPNQYETQSPSRPLFANLDDCGRYIELIEPALRKEYGSHLTVITCMDNEPEATYLPPLGSDQR
jgi:hypothetical protein